MVRGSKMKTKRSRSKLTSSSLLLVQHLQVKMVTLFLLQASQLIRMAGDVIICHFFSRKDIRQNRYRICYVAQKIMKTHLDIVTTSIFNLIMVWYDNLTNLSPLDSFFSISIEFAYRRANRSDNSCN